MNFSELFIRRPVLTIVTSILVLLLGIQGFFNMTVREYPEVEELVITVTTVYPGASASLMQGFITTPIAKAVLNADNVDYVTSSSTLGSSTVSVNMVLNADPDQALVDVLAKVQQVRGQLPTDAEDPVVVKGTGFAFRADVHRRPLDDDEPAAGDGVPDAGRAAALHHGRRRRRRADPRRPGIRHARLARSDAARRAQRHRESTC